MTVYDRIRARTTPETREKVQQQMQTLIKNPKYTIIFSFLFNENLWWWERTFNSNEPIQETIDNYLELKKLPFEISKDEVKYKIKK